MIPQVNPKANYLAHKAEIDAAIKKVLDSGRYILGEEVSEFENEFKNYLQVNHAVGVANGTDAIELALQACGLGPGDKVATVSHTAVATVAAIERAGAVPVFVDINSDTYTISPESFKNLLKKTPDIKAVIPVHLYGHPADLSDILSLANQHGIFVIEDCAQAHGAEFSQKKVGTWGNLGTFSFYPTKNLGAIGDGGMVVTNDQKLADRVRQLREYGWKERYVSAESGINSRLDEIQAAILRIKLKYLDSENRRRFAIANNYTVNLKSVLAGLPLIKDIASHVFHQYVIRTPQRDFLKSHLSESGINTAIHYPFPVHLQPAYQGRIPLLVPLTTTEAVAKEILSLPMFPELSSENADFIANKIKQVLSSH